MPEFSPGVLVAWRIAALEAAQTKFEFIQREHLMMGITKLQGASDGALAELIEDPAILSGVKEEISALTAFFTRQKLDAGKTFGRLRQMMGTGSCQTIDPGAMHRDPECRQIFQGARSYVAEPSALVAILHLLGALLAKPGVRVAQAIASSGVDLQVLQSDILKELSLKAQPAPASPTEAPLSSGLLARFGVDLTDQAASGQGDSLIGRRDEMLQIVRTLTRKTKRNPLLLGDPGVGKTALVRALARRIMQRRVPPELQDKRIVELNVGALVAGTKYRGDFESRITGIISEAAKRPDVILFIDEIHTLTSMGGGEGAVDAANILKPALAGSELRVIGSTTTAEYRKYFERDAALARRFQPIIIDEPSPEDAIKILAGNREFYETHHGVHIASSAIRSAVELSCRYFPERKLPDKALDLLDEACARVKISTLSFRSESSDLSALAPTPVSSEQVAEVVAERTGISVSRLSAEGQEKLQRMGDVLNERVIGQPDAVERVTRLVTMSRAGLRDSDKPIGVLLFVGPTGVGKTELCKALAEFLFGSENQLIRLDMSEYKEPHSVSRLIGSPPGYVGYEEEGQLTGRIRRKPYSVVLLDEIEKAHPQVWDLFLQLFDEGKLTDSHGRTADGRHAIYIMTSNIPITQDGNKKVGFGFGGPVDSAADPETRKAIEERLLREFRPEFLNRIDEIVAFRPLSMDGIRVIAARMLSQVSGLLADRGIELRFSPPAIELIAKAGYDPANGARPLARAIDRIVNGPLSHKAVAGEIKSGDCVEAVIEAGAVCFRVGEYGGAGFRTV